MLHRVPVIVSLLALAAPVAVGILVDSAPCGYAASEAATDPLEGTWRYRSMEVGGETVPGPSGFEYVFRGGRAQFRSDREVRAEYTYRLDRSQTPAHLDLIEQSDKGETVRRGICVIDGDTLRWCSSMRPDGPRPTAFKTRPQGGTKYCVLFRIPESVPAPSVRAADHAVPPGGGHPDAGTAPAQASSGPPLAMPRRFKLTWLDTPAGRNSIVTDMNNRGQVVGEIGEGDAMRPCLWTDGKREVPPGFDRHAATIYGINDDGVLAGTHVLGEQGTPYLYADGQLQELTLDVKYPVLLAYGVNARRQVVGVAFHPMKVTSAWLWENGKIRSLGTLGGYIAEAMAVNARRQVTGFSNRRDYGPSHAFLWDSGEMQDLGTLGGMESKGYDLNDAGQVVGVSKTAAGGDRAFLWSDGRMQDLGVLPGGRASWAWSVNNSRMVGGWSRNASGKQHAAVWYQGRVHDLNDMVDDLQGWTLVVARAVNDRGWMAGTATQGGQRRAYLLEPLFDDAAPVKPAKAASRGALLAAD